MFRLTKPLLVCVLFLTSPHLQAQIAIYSPLTGAIVTSPVSLTASISTAQATTFDVYDNGALIFEQTKTASIGTSVNLATGVHTIVVKSLSAGGNVSATAVVTVSGQAATNLSTNVGVEIAPDMSGQNEGYPHGVPLSYAWAKGPVVEMGNNPNGWKAMTGWGVVYEASQGNPAVNTRVNIRDVQSYLLQKSTGKWLLLQNTNTPDGADYLENFTGNTNVPSNMRTEPDGTISVTAGGGYNFHFYPSVRGSISPSDISGIVTIFQARLIVNNTALADDRGIAEYLAGSGGDYYPALTGTWPGNLSYNPGIAMGKEKYVKNYWRFFSMNTMSATQLKENPPPINLTGVAQ